MLATFSFDWWLNRLDRAVSNGEHFEPIFDQITELFGTNPEVLRTRVGLVSLEKSLDHIFK